MSRLELNIIGVVGISIAIKTIRIFEEKIGSNDITLIYSPKRGSRTAFAIIKKR